MPQFVNSRSFGFLSIPLCVIAITGSFGRVQVQLRNKREKSRFCSSASRVADVKLGFEQNGDACLRGGS